MYSRAWLLSLPWLLVVGGCVDLRRPSQLGVSVMPLDARPEAMVPADARPDRPEGDGEDVPVGFDLEPEVGEPDGDDGPPIDEPGPADAPPEVVEVGNDVPPPPVDTPLANGSVCTAGTACASTFCVDGVCCESLCNSACYGCAVAGSAGRCAPIAAGLDPGNDCAPAVCVGSTETSKATCDGAGACRPGSVRECAPYLCGTATCRTSCNLTAECKAGYSCVGNACVVQTADAGVDTTPPMMGILTVDDFSDANLRSNTMGGTVTWDNQNVALVGGQVRFTWNNVNVFQDFIETFLPNFCSYDIRNYRTLRFKMRASTGPRTLRIFYARSNGTCGVNATPQIATISVGTTLNTYDVDLTTQPRDKAIFVEWSPSTLDGTDYFLDDVQLVP